MENKPLLKATITIEEISQKGSRFTVKPTAGPKYSFFQTKTGGSETMAYRQMNDMGLKPGMTVNIGYDETPGDFQGKPITYRNIKHFSEAAIHVDDQPDYDAIRDQKSNDIKEAQEIRAKEFDRLIEALDKLTNKIDELVLDKKVDAVTKKDDVNVEDIPF